ncbi:MAG: hypothetical protein AB1665_05085 [Candidatus Thermoplasmatota archaeon]
MHGWYRGEINGLSRVRAVKLFQECRGTNGVVKYRGLIAGIVSSLLGLLLILSLLPMTHIGALALLPYIVGLGLIGCWGWKYDVIHGSRAIGLHSHPEPRKEQELET